MSIARLMQMGAAGSAGAGPEPSDWTDPDLGNASYDSVSFSVASQETVPLGLYFIPDGSKMYVIGNSSDNVNEYDLSTPWDVSTASFVQSFSVASQDSSPTSIFFKPDGLKMYVNGNANHSVFEYDLSTAWDISSASYLQSFSGISEDTSILATTFSQDGSKMYMSGNTYNNINEYDLSTPWNVSTASFVQGFNIAAQEGTPRGTYFNPDGTKFFLIGNGSDNVNEYGISTPFDLSTASFIQSFSVASQETGPVGLFFKADGSKMYIVGFSNDTVYQYSTA